MNLSQDELVCVLDFLIWKIKDYWYSKALLLLSNLVVEFYGGVIGFSPSVKGKFEEF